MKTIVSLIGLTSTLAITNALAWERVLLDRYTAPQNWEISSQELGLKPPSLSLSACAPCMADGRKAFVSSILILGQ
jgi:hypothetical protein